MIATFEIMVKDDCGRLSHCLIEAPAKSFMADAKFIARAGDDG
jgi:hypothetical protein